MTGLSSSSQILFCVGCNHKVVPIEKRESLALSDEELTGALPKVRSAFALQEIAALSTCNRFEVFGVISGPCDLAGIDTLLLQVYTALHREAGKQPLLEGFDLAQHAYRLLNEDAIRHTFAVASSLDSLVVGETQITGQFKDAMTIAAKANTFGPMLARLSQEALATAKKVRSQTDIGKKSVSIGHAAIDLAKKVFGDLSAHRFLVVGAGDMARIASLRALSYKPVSLTIVNRSLARAEALAESLPAHVEARPLDDLEKELASADIVICATAAPGFVISPYMVEHALLHRPTARLFFVDIALPRDIDPAVGRFDNVYLFDIDDLRQVVDDHMAERQEAARIAMGLVNAQTENFSRWLSTYGTKGALGAVRSYFEDLLERELSTTLGKEAMRPLTAEQKEHLAQMVAAAARKITGDVGQALSQLEPASFEQQSLQIALSSLFPAPRGRAK